MKDKVIELGQRLHIAFFLTADQFELAQVPNVDPSNPPKLGRWARTIVSWGLGGLLIVALAALFVGLGLWVLGSLSSDPSRSRQGKAASGIAIVVVLLAAGASSLLDLGWDIGRRI